MDQHVLTTVATVLSSTALHGTALHDTVLHGTALVSAALARSAGTTPQELPGFLNSLAPVIHHYGVWAIVLFVFLEDFGVPVPGETVLIAGAVFAGTGNPNIIAVYIAGFVAAVAGDNLGYAIGRFGGRAVVDRWGKYVFLTPERLDKAENFFNRHGGKIIVIARFVEGLRQANGLIAGITEMHWLKFVAFNALGAALWVGTWVSVGYFAGQHITAIYDAITRYSLYAAIAAAVVIVAWIGLRIRKRRRSAVAGHIPQETQGQNAATDDAGTGNAGTDGPANDADAEENQPEETPAKDAPVTDTRVTDTPITDTPADAGDGPQDNSARS